MTMQITRLLGDEASGGAASPSAQWDPADTDQPRPTSRGGIRKVFGWPLLVVMIVALWPAAWGGLTGFSIVNGSSMESVYNTDDVVLTLRQSTYAVGDIVSYQVPAGQDGAGEKIIHRIVEIDDSAEEPIFITQGDNNPSVDAWTISTADVVGKAVLHAPRIGAAFRGSHGLLLVAMAGLAVLAVSRPSQSGAGKSAQETNRETSTNGHPFEF